MASLAFKLNQSISAGIPSGPSPKAASLTLDTVYDPPVRAFIVQTTGSIQVIDADGNTVTLPTVASGIVVPLSIQKVISGAGTTCGTVVGLY